jgi:thymidylate synthase ThyX
MLTVKKVYDSASGTLEIPSEVLPENGLPFSHHFTSTPGDNLIELAGKICYDSCQNPKSRDSKSYHQHINEVGHHSTHGHLNITIELPINKHTDELYEYLTCFTNKPGFHIVLTNKDAYTQNLRITGNLRAIREWFTFNTEIPKESGKFDYIGYCLQSWARLVAPEAIKGAAGNSQLYKYAGSLVTPQDANEIWASFYIGGISRNAITELIRHGYSTGISQRSTRFVNEGESEYIWHPLLQKYYKEWLNTCWVYDSVQVIINYPTCKNNPNTNLVGSLEEIGKELYNKTFEFLQQKLLDEGLDKATARKQSFGAARCLLASCLNTELIFSASLAQWQRIILMRSRDEADAEIRLMTNKIFHILKEKWPSHFYNLTSRPAKDGIGEHIEQL